MDKLRIVAAEHPLLQYKEKGEIKGTTVAIVNMLLTEAKLSAEIEFLPWARAYNLAEHRPNTLILSMIRTKNREKKFHWLGIVSNLVRVYIFLKDKPENYVNNDDEAMQKTVAVVRGSNSFNELTRKGFVEGKNLYVVSSMQQAFKLLIKGKIDLVYNDPHSVKEFINNNLLGSSHQISYSAITSKNNINSYIAISMNSSPELVSKLKKAMRKVIKTAQYQYLLTH